jgi:beta-lactamase regulating signal transducer with metallopeptidase domain
MYDRDLIVLTVSFVYSAAAAGLVIGRLGLGFLRQSGRRPFVAEAAWCAWLPLLTVGLMPLSALWPHPNHPLGAAHQLWHDWERQVHAVPVAHGLLHGANCAVLLFAAVGAVRAAYFLARMRGFAASIQAAAVPAGFELEGVPVYRISAKQPLCFTMGVVRPGVYFSDPLREALSARDFEAVLAHEAAHVRRRDPALRTLLFLFFVLLPLPGSRLLMAQWEQAAERQCDAEAAAHIGSGTDVAAALIRVAQANTLAPAIPAGPCFAVVDDDIEGRVHALLSCNCRPRSSVPALVGATLLGLLVTSLWISHVVEFFAHH